MASSRSREIDFESSLPSHTLRDLEDATFLLGESWSVVYQAQNIWG